jgi:hypothetical protein
MPDEHKCEVLGVRGLKEEFGFSEGLQRKKRNEGNFIPFFFAGNRVRYRRAAVESWIAQQEQLAQRGSERA